MTNGQVLDHPYAFESKEVLKSLNTSKDGLTTDEAKKRIRYWGSNRWGVSHKNTAFVVFLSQLQNWLVLILIGASLVSFYLGEKIDSLVILGMVFLSIIFGFIQEYRAEKSLEHLKKYISHKTRAKRDGEFKEINSQRLTIGDIIKLRIGDLIPADIRLLVTDTFTVDESILTGESVPIEKTKEKIKNTQIPLQKQKNMAFAGTHVSTGDALGVVVAIGDKTELGKTAKSLEEPAPATDFQKQINNFSRYLFKIIIILTLFVFLSNSYLGRGYLDSFLFAVALAIGIAPELLPMVVTVTLSEGALKMAKNKVVVKKLISVEDLGNIDTLCADKTGTLTVGKFHLHGFLNDKFEEDKNVLIWALLSTGNFADGKKASANDLDKALWEAPQSKTEISRLKGYTIRDENEFDFQRRRASAVIEKGREKTMIVKGAAESVLPVCRFSQRVEKEKILNKISEYEASGYRIILLASKKTDKTETDAQDEKDLDYLGMLAFTDPVKTTARESVELFRKLGVDIKIISGDSPKIVKRVAREVGLISEDTKVVTGDDLLNLKKDKFLEFAKKYKLFARTTPEQKRALVESLNHEGHIVGFLGDGVNDAPALKASDVGISVDTGSEIAKEAANIVLLEKNLHVLAEGIKTGRKTFGNITKYILNTISANYGNMLTVALSSLFLNFIPLLPSQILLNNFISDIPLLAIANDNVDGTFIRKPKRWNIKLIGRFMLYFGIESSIFDFATILPLIFIWKLSPAPFRTVWFIESAISEMIVTFSIRTRLPFYRSRPSSWLIILSILSILAVIAISLLPWGRYLFELANLPFYLYIFIGVILIVYFGTTEIAKGLFFRNFDFENYNTVKPRGRK